jgi:hypothetical protein
MAYAQLETHHADLASDFGLEWATKLFGADAIASLPIRQAGKHKGKPKGFVIWRKATVAGYCREVQSPLKVGGLADAWIGEGPLSWRSNAMAGQWLGRNQSLAASFSVGVFFDEGRARHAAEQARLAADWAAQRREMKA